MKIIDIVCRQLAADVAEPFTPSRGRLYAKRQTLIVEIRTDEGITGWGECYGPSAIARATIESVFKAQVVGRDPFDGEVIWEHLYNRIKDYGLSGMTIAAISGIDIALWDIIGKACGKPIHKLIGGAFRERVLAYATGLYFKDFDRLTEEAVEEALAFEARGFRAVKMKIGLGDLERDVARIAAVREALGPDIRLMVDANHCFGVPDAMVGIDHQADRSEEHTSELQSLMRISYAVFCLKKKKHIRTINL